MICLHCDGDGSLDCGCRRVPAPPASAPVRREPPPWPAWVGRVIAEYERRVDAGDILGAALHVGSWPDGLRECQCHASGGEVESPDGYVPCRACGGWTYLWDAPETGAESEAA